MSGCLNRRFVEPVAEPGEHAHLGHATRGIDRQLNAHLAFHTGSARLVGWFSGVARSVQTGFLNHYAIALIVGLAIGLYWFIPLLTRR